LDRKGATAKLNRKDWGRDADPKTDFEFARILVKKWLFDWAALRY
jgi:hypothetical protein